MVLIIGMHIISRNCVADDAFIVYRCIVVSRDNQWICSYNKCELVQEARMRSYPSSTVTASKCSHVAFAKALQTSSQTSLKPLRLNPSVLEAIAIPTDVKSKLMKFSNEEGMDNTLIKLVSKSCFVIHDFTSSHEGTVGHNINFDP